ncbi:DUF3306 domain-containing protein [Falsiroseomonas sp. CW058]|uniref:DUF3306 domain-containing protein n=1 Tax=Falsiroseomonas sp. CW058 TaxID=3388664 RepID=UPI003D315E73
MSGEGFLARWSRRKRGAAEEIEEAAAPAPAEPPVAPETPPAAEPMPVELPAEAPPAGSPPAACPVPGVAEIDAASLPRIEDLTAASDLGPFLRPGVPAALRSAALRRMWSVDPAIRDFIGCVDYQWDFNTPGGLPFGFAAELGGDAAKLLAQAIGLGEDGAPHRAAEAPAPDAAAAEASAEAPAPAEPPPAPEPSAEAAAPVEEPQPEPSTPRRRHGSALPA